MRVLSLISILCGNCPCDDCEQMRAVCRPRRRGGSVDRLAIALRGGPSPAVVDGILISLFGTVLAGGGYALLMATLHFAVFLSPGASAASSPAVRQSQTASAEAAAGPTYQVRP